MTDEITRTNEWVEKAKRVHPEYDYSKVVYVNNLTNVIIICKKHGEFSISPKAFIKEDYKCAKCKKEETVRNRFMEYIKKAKEKYNSYYEYDLSKCVTSHEKIRMICPEHGDFWMSLHSHLSGNKCPKCSYGAAGKNRRKTTEEFIKEAKSVHGDKYDYSKTVYVKQEENVCIICPKHGEFWMNPKSHLCGNGCSKCSGKYRKNTEEFIEEAKGIHGDKYDYSKVKYVDNSTKVCIICHEKDEFGVEHGEFWQTPKLHLRGYGCRKCVNKYMDTELFIKKANLIHNGKYDYSKAVYKGVNEKVCIICPEHGEFWQNYDSHLCGRGCPYCNESHLEREICISLEKNNITFERQKYFDWLRNDLTNYKLPLDFYLPEYGIAIECQGEQHFIPNFYKSKGDEFAENHLDGVQYRDSRKKSLCKENNVRLVYFLEKRFAEFMKEGDIYFTGTEDLLAFIKKVRK